MNEEIFSYTLTSDDFTGVAQAFEMDDSMEIGLSREQIVELRKRLLNAVETELSKFLEELLS